jgi:hypothetical protein
MGGQRSTYLKIRLTKEQRPTGVSRQTKLPRITKSGPAKGQKGSKEKTACSCPGSDPRSTLWGKPGDVGGTWERDGEFAT